MIKRILVPLDGSELAESALPYAQAVASKTGAEVTLLTSLHNVDSWAGRPVQTDKESVALVHDYLEAKGRELVSEGLSVKTDIGSDPAAEAIIDHLTNEDEDLIVMSTHGRSGITRWVFGSVAHKVLHAAHCPILLIRPSSPPLEANDMPDIQKIVVPLDGSEHSLTALPVIEDFAKAFKASLILLNVVLPLTAYVGAEFVTPTRNFLEEQITWARKFLSSVGKDVQSRGVEATSMVMVGTGASEIVRGAEDAKADMIAFSTHGRSGLSRSLMGSVADAVVHRANLPCLVVRPPEIKQS